MTKYGLAHGVVWKGMHGISREGEPATLEAIWKNRKPSGAYLRWKYLHTGHHATTNIDGCTAHWNPARWMYMDIIWWELPTLEQVLALPA